MENMNVSHRLVITNWDVIRITAVATITCGFTIAAVKKLTQNLTGLASEVNEQAKKMADQMEEKDS